MADLASLVIKLSADVASLQSDLGKAGVLSEQAAKRMQRAFEEGFAKIHESAKRGVDGIGEALQNLTGLSAGQLGLGAVIAGLGEVTKAAIETGDQFNKMAQRTGVSVEALSGIAFAANLADVATGDFGVSMEKFAKTIGAAAGGSKDQAAAFQAIGINIKDASGNIKPLDTLLGQVSDKFKGYKDGVEKTTLAQALFGKSGAAMIPLLNQGSEGLRKSSEEAKALGYNFTAIAQESEDFNDNLTRLSKAAVGVGVDIAAQLLPVFIRVEEGLLDLIKSARETGWLQDIASGIGFLVQNLDTLAVMLASKLAIGAAIALFEALAGSATIAAGAVAALEGVLGLLGGPAGVLALAAGATYFLLTKQDDAVTSTNMLKEAQDRLAGATNATRESEERAAQTKIELAKRTITATEALIAQAQAYADQDTSSVTSNFGEGASLAANASALWAGRADELRGELGKLKEQLADTSREMSIAAAITDLGGDGAKRTAPNVSGLGKAHEDAAKAAKEYADSITKAAEMLSKFEGAVDPAAKILQTYVRAQIEVNAQAADMVEKGAAAGHAQEAIAAATEFATRASAANVAALTKQTAALAKQGDVLGNYLDDLKKSSALIGLSDKQKAVATAIQKVTDAYEENTAKGIRNAQSLADVATGAGAAAAAAFDLQKKQSDMDSIVSQFGSQSEWDQLQENLKKTGEAIESTWDVTKLAPYIRAQDNIRKSESQRNDELLGKGISSLQSFAKEGTAAYTALGIAQDLLAYKSAITAIATQGGGDPYTAFARIAAMIALMASIGIRVAGGGSSGPSAQSAEARQASQGTGTVLGDAAAQSQSIAKSVEITASATSQLPGLSRGMLTALQALQHALGAAGNQLARGAANVPFAGPQDNIINLAGPGSSDPIGGMLGSFLFGGSQEIIDKGIIIAGGALKDMLHGIVVGAYQTIQTDGGLFGSDSTSDQLSDVSSAFSKQFQLVIKSIADTVNAGATALGLLPADIAAAMDKFKVEEIRISLEGLSADDQQKALEAVFSSIFDGLAASVVPFIDQFQKVGEGLGETLVRIATEVQVAQEAFKQLGLSVAETDPEKFAQISDGLITAAGGLDDFISGMQSFVQNFSDAAHQMDVSSTALASEFSQVGLTVPETSQGMWDLMQSLDATTESGQAQIATLLRLSDTAKSYYDQLDEFSKTLGLDGNSQFNRNLNSIRDASIGLIKALSKAGASTETLQHVYDASVDKINELVAQMEASAQSIAFSLGISNKGSLSEVNSEIDRLQGIADAASGSVQGFGNAMQEASRQASDAIALLLGDLSPLNDQKKLQIALAGLQSGTVTQDQVLEIGRRLYASTQKYNDLFAMVQQYPGSSGPADGGGFTAGGVQSQGLSQAQSDRLSELLKEQVTLQAAAQLGQYQDLAQRIAQIALAKGEDFQQVIDEMGIKNVDLEKGLGLANDDALKTYIENEQKANKDGTTSIVTVLTQIRDILSGKPTNDGTTPEVPGMVHSGRGNTPTDVAVTVGQVIGNHIGRTLAPYQGNQPRSTRAPVRVN